MQNPQNMLHPLSTSIPVRYFCIITKQNTCTDDWSLNIALQLFTVQYFWESNKHYMYIVVWWIFLGLKLSIKEVYSANGNLTNYSKQWNLNHLKSEPLFHILRRGMCQKWNFTLWSQIYAMWHPRNQSWQFTCNVWHHDDELWAVLCDVKNWRHSNTAMWLTLFETIATIKYSTTDWTEYDSDQTQCSAVEHNSHPLNRKVHWTTHSAVMY